MAPDAAHLVTAVDTPASSAIALATLSEPLHRWFGKRFGIPTVAQCLAWPVLAAGRNLLLCAPTGGGKTLAAFLPILNDLLESPFAPGVRCIYLAPLKALGNDVRTTLRSLLVELRPFLPTATRRLRVGLRTGDTSARVRVRQRIVPPDILLTTPESLAVLLAGPAASDLFASLRWVVVDEVHALAPDKRGADLSLSLERLDDLTGGQLHRVGLSATCSPPDVAARFLVGVGRQCTIAQAGEPGPLQLTVEPLAETDSGFLSRLTERLEPELLAQRTTLIFANTRGLAERLAWALRRRFPAWMDEVAVHHSAVAARRRREIERWLKAGRLRAVVSSTSLELGVDIGSVDGVVLVHPPGGVVRMLQRVGRSGHAPGGARRGLVLTASPAELLEAAVTASSGRADQCEPLRMQRHPLDVLCQQLLGLAAQGAWTADDAYLLVRRAAPYHDLLRQDFDDCLDYLSGRGRDGRPWLPERLRWHGEHFTLTDERTARLVRRNLGTILADEPRPVCYFDEAAEDARGLAIGSVAEPFADRLQPGDRFLLDGRCLEVRRADGRGVLVDEVMGRPIVPRWGGDGWLLSADLARRLYLLRVQAAEALRDGPEALADLLRRDYQLNGRAVGELVALFQRQECVSEVPDGDSCLIEAVAAEGGADYYVHTSLNRAGNDALARAAVLRLARTWGRTASSVVADLGFVLVVPGHPELLAADLRGLLSPCNFVADLATALAESDSLRERFRRAALTGLMLLRNPLGRRHRVGGRSWPERRLFEQVRAADPRFVLLRQAEREVRDSCDEAAAIEYLAALGQRPLRVRWLGQVSPLAEGWTQAVAGPVGHTDGPAEALERLHALLSGADRGPKTG